MSFLDLGPNLRYPQSETVPISSAQEQKIFGPRAESVRTFAWTCVLFERDVEVRAPEAKRANRAPSWMTAAPDPRTCLRIDIQRPVLKTELSVGPTHFKGRG